MQMTFLLNSHLSRNLKENMFLPPLITDRNEVVAKVIFLHLFVILFTGGVLPQCMLEYQPPPRADPPEQTPPDQAQAPPPREQNPWGQTPPRADTHPGNRLQHTVYEWPVRILLECILVTNCERTHLLCYMNNGNKIVNRVLMQLSVSA